jgi:protein TonB
MGAGREDRTLVSSLTAPTASVPVLDLTHVPVASPARVVKRFNPVYPPAAFSNGREGDVVLDVTVKPNGKVGAVHVADGQPEFARAAVDAVRLWRYEPYRLNGKPSEVTTRVVVRFRLPSRK